MKTCHVCGEQVDDKILICPVCGATVVGDTGGLTLKAPAPEKKKTGNPMGMTVSTGSGLTDILRGDDGDAEVEDEFYGGSIPVSLSKTYVEDDTDYDAIRDKKIFKKRLRTWIVLILITIAGFIIFGRLSKKETGADTPEKAIEYYVEAVNNADVDKMELIIPSYLDDAEGTAKEFIDKMKGAHIDSYNITSSKVLDGDELNTLQDSIKYQTSKTANIKGANTVTVTMKGSAERNGNKESVYTEITFQLVKLRKGMSEFYYIHVDTYDNPDFQYR